MKKTPSRFKKALRHWQKSRCICAMMCFSVGAGEKTAYGTLDQRVNSAVPTEALGHSPSANQPSEICVLIRSGSGNAGDLGREGRVLAQNR